MSFSHLTPRGESKTHTSGNTTTVARAGFGPGKPQLPQHISGSWLLEMDRGKSKLSLGLDSFFRSTMSFCRVHGWEEREERDKVREEIRPGW